MSNMNGIDKEMLENQIRDMSDEDMAWLCTLLPDKPLANELGMRLVRFRKYSEKAKEELCKVV